jgi:hypothetical protein
MSAENDKKSQAIKRIEEICGAPTANHSRFWIELHNLVHGEHELWGWTCVRAVSKATIRQMNTALRNAKPNECRERNPLSV